jgi:hypothetical protein
MGLMTGMSLKTDDPSCASISNQLKTQSLCPCSYQTTTTNTIANLTGSINSGNNVVSLTASPGVDYSGDYIVGTGIPTSTIVSSSGSATLNLSQEATLTAINVPFSIQTYSYANSFDVMCSTSADDSQWSPTNRDAWIASFNNILEAILNNPDFYDEYQPQTQTTQ